MVGAGVDSTLERLIERGRDDALWGREMEISTEIGKYRKRKLWSKSFPASGIENKSGSAYIVHITLRVSRNDPRIALVPNCGLYIGFLRSNDTRIYTGIDATNV